MIDSSERYWVSWLRWHGYQRWKFRKNKKRRFKGALLRLRACLRQLPPGSLVIDCGANVGDVTEFFVRHGMRVIAFEPDPVALEILRERFGRHKDVEIVPKAVGRNGGTASLFQNPAVSRGAIEATQGSSLFHQDHHDHELMRVDVVDLACFIRSLNERVRVLKIDIEGYEAEVLEALLETKLYREIDLILIETHFKISGELTRRLEALRDRIVDQRIGNISLDWR